MSPWRHSANNSSCTHLIKENGDRFGTTLLSSCSRRTSGDFKKISSAKEFGEFSWPWQTRVVVAGRGDSSGNRVT